MVNIPGAIASLQGVLTSLAKETAKAEVLERLFEAQALLMDLQAHQSDLSEENRELRDQLQEAQVALELSRNLIHRHNAYWYPDDDGKLEGPFATVDWDRDRQMVRLKMVEQRKESGVEVVMFIDDKLSCFFIPIEFIRESTRIDPTDILEYKRLSLSEKQAEMRARRK